MKDGVGSILHWGEISYASLSELWRNANRSAAQHPPTIILKQGGS